MTPCLAGSRQLALIGFVIELDRRFWLTNTGNWVCLAPMGTPPPAGALRRPAGARLALFFHPILVFTLTMAKIGFVWRN
jgi:hypothetical protein